MTIDGFKGQDSQLLKTKANTKLRLRRSLAREPVAKWAEVPVLAGEGPTPSIDWLPKSLSPACAAPDTGNQRASTDRAAGTHFYC